MCAAEEEHEQRWVAQRGQQTAAVSYQRDEEKDGVNLVFTLFVGLDERTDKQHGCARRTHDRG